MGLDYPWFMLINVYVGCRKRLACDNISKMQYRCRCRWIVKEVSDTDSLISIYCINLTNYLIET